MSAIPSLQFFSNIIILLIVYHNVGSTDRIVSISFVNDSARMKCAAAFASVSSESIYLDLLIVLIILLFRNNTDAQEGKQSFDLF